MASAQQSQKLNVFQRAMLQWNDMHPYNAVHLLRFQGAPDVQRLRKAIATRLGLLGLASVQIDRQKATYAYQDHGPPGELVSIANGAGCGHTLQSEIERQLNSRFHVTGRFAPIRFFVLQEGNDFLLGATYFHPIADAESMVLLLRELAVDYLTGRTPENVPPLERHPPRHDRLRPAAFKVTARKLLELPSDIRIMRHSFRAPLRSPGDLSNHFRFMTVKPDGLNWLIQTAKDWNVTLHDLLLAMLMKALANIAPERYGENRRCNISLGSIVNVRRDYGIDSERTFGLFLGSFVVTHAVPLSIPLRHLATDVHLQTARIKRNKLYLATPLELRIAGRLMALYSAPRQKAFYHKHHPLWGGISNMNLNTLWTEDAAARPLDYFRAVSTGPATPLVLSATTFRNHLNLGFTYRPALFTAEEITCILEQLRLQLSESEVTS